MGSIPKNQEVASQTARGDMAAAMGQKDETRKACEAAIASARQMAPDAQVSFIPELEGKLRKLWVDSEN